MFVSETQAEINEIVEKMQNRFPLKENHIYFIPTPVKASMENQKGILEYDGCSGTYAVMGGFRKSGCIFYELIYNDANCTFYHAYCADEKIYNNSKEFLISYEVIEKVFPFMKDVTDIVPFKENDNFLKVQQLRNTVYSKIDIINVPVVITAFAIPAAVIGLLLYLAVQALPVDISAVIVSDFTTTELIWFFIVAMAGVGYVFGIFFWLPFLRDEAETKDGMFLKLHIAVTKKEANAIMSIRDTCMSTYKDFISRHNAAECVIYPYIDYEYLLIYGHSKEDDE